MGRLNKKQKTLIDQFITDYHAGSGGAYPLDIEMVNPIIWHEIEEANDYETLTQDANRYLSDKVMPLIYG